MDIPPSVNSEVSGRRDLVVPPFIPAQKTYQITVTVIFLNERSQRIGNIDRSVRSCGNGPGSIDRSPAAPGKIVGKIFKRRRCLNGYGKETLHKLIVTGGNLRNPADHLVRFVDLFCRCRPDGGHKTGNGKGSFEHGTFRLPAITHHSRYVIRTAGNLTGNGKTPEGHRLACPDRSVDPYTVRNKPPGIGQLDGLREKFRVNAAGIFEQEVHRVTGSDGFRPPVQNGK